MKSVTISILCGFIGGLIASAVAFVFLTGSWRGADMVTIQYGPAPEQTKLITLLESTPRPSGYYVRYRNEDTRECESTHFVIRASKDGKLWHSWEVSDYFEIAPGAEREAILKPMPHEGGAFPDLSTYDVTVEVMYAYKKRKA